MENIPGLIFVFGAAFIVGVIILHDICTKEQVGRSYAKWVTVFLLSTWQVGCWHTLNSFSRSFGTRSGMEHYTTIFVSVVAIWFFLKIIGCYRGKN
jgi:hypothetical protein